MSSSTPGSLAGLPTVAIGYVNQPFDTNDVSVYASVSFTAVELSAPALVKTIILRYDPRQAPFLTAFGCPASSDGSDFYYVDMDPHSGGENRFSIRKVIGGTPTILLVSSIPYDWPPDVKHDVYFGCSWDPVTETNHLRAILYMSDLEHPIADIAVDDGSIPPGNLWPSNNNNKYTGFLVSNDHGGPINNMCTGTASRTYCPGGFNQFLVTDKTLQGSDADVDGVADGCDSCLNTVPGSSVDANGCPPLIPGDIDRDGDVDDDDAVAFTACRSGPGVPNSNPASCQAADLDHDLDVDQDDFGILQRCYSGRNVVGNPSCAQ